MDNTRIDPLAPRWVAVLLACAGFVAAGLITSCEAPIPSVPVGSLDSSPPTNNGKSSCAESIGRIDMNLSGAAARIVEDLQAQFERDPGFLAVVFDGAEPVVIVDRNQLAAWRARLGAIAAAPSCVDVSLLEEVKAVLPSVANGGGIASAGYNAETDSIDVHGADFEALMLALEKLHPGSGEAARTSLAAGTLRVDPRLFR